MYRAPFIVLLSLGNVFGVVTFTVEKTETATVTECRELTVGELLHSVEIVPSKP